MRTRFTWLCELGNRDIKKTVATLRVTIDLCDGGNECVGVYNIYYYYMFVFTRRKSQLTSNEESNDLLPLDNIMGMCKKGN